MKLERRRRRALALLQAGLSQAKVARRVRASASSVQRWRQIARGGLRRLAAKPHPGRPRRLTPAQHRELQCLLRKRATAHGWPNEQWTGERVAAVIRRAFGVRYHPDHVRKLLRTRLGWPSQKPKRRTRERGKGELARGETRGASSPCGCSSRSGFRSKWTKNVAELVTPRAR